MASFSPPLRLAWFVGKIEGGDWMIGVWTHHAQTFLLVLAALTPVLFSIPIAFAPLQWARLVGWRIPESRDLALYFGRCLGAFALILNFFMFRAALTAEAMTPTFEFMAMVLDLDDRCAHHWRNPARSAGYRDARNRLLDCVGAADCGLLASSKLIRSLAPRASH
jgi:hypothetical protein